MEVVRGRGARDSLVEDGLALGVGMGNMTVLKISFRI